MAIKIRIEMESNAAQAAKKTKGAVEEISKSGKKATKQMEQDWKDVAAAVGIAMIAYAKIKRVFDQLIAAYEKQLVAETKLEAALIATGHAAGFTKNQLLSMAESLAAVTTYGDEALIEAQSLLLTFTKIGKDVFPLALESAADMSAMFGQDLKQSAIQLGTALNDPIAGIGRLRRIGISFTAEQKKMIEGFVDANDIMSAQKVILDELQAEFGGVARAVGDTAIGQLKRLNNAWGDMQEKAGQALLEGLVPLLESLENFVAFLEANTDSIRLAGEAISFFAIPLIEVAKFLLNPFDVVGLVNSIGKAEASFQALKSSAVEFAGTEVKAAASGMTTDLNTLNITLEKAKEKVVELEQGFIDSNQENRDELMSLMNEYDEHIRQIERQIEIQKELKLIEDTRAGVVFDMAEYGKAIGIVNKKLAESKNALNEVMTVQEEIARIQGDAYEPPDVSQLKAQINHWEKVYEEIINVANEVKRYGSEWKEVVEKRIALEEQYQEKYFKLVADRATILEKEKEATIEAAEEVGASTYDISRYYDEQIRRENQKAIQDRENFEIGYIKKFEQITLDRVTLLEKEMEEALNIAREKGADELLVMQYYEEQISQFRDEEQKELIKQEKENLKKLEQEYQRHAEERKRFEEDVVNYIQGLANQWLLSESELLEKQKAQEVQRIKDVADRWREEIGYIVDAAGNIRLKMDPPDEYADTLVDMELSMEEINAYAEEYAAALAEAETAEKNIRIAIATGADEYDERIRQAKELERIENLVGSAHLDTYEILKQVTQEMRSQEAIQRDAIEQQIRMLNELISSIQTEMAQAGVEAGTVAGVAFQNLINQANQAILYLTSELAKIPTEADKAFLELVEKVGVISEKYKDPLEKKRQLLEKEIEEVSKYLILLEKKLAMQRIHIATLDYGSEVYNEEIENITALAEEIKKIKELSELLDKNLDEVEQQLNESAGEIKKYTIKSFEEVIDEIRTAMIMAFVQFPENIGDIVKTVAQGISSLVEGTFKLFTNPIKQIKVIFDRLVLGISETSINILDGLTSLYDSFFKGGIEKFAASEGKEVSELTEGELGTARLFAAFDSLASIVTSLVNVFINLVLSSSAFQEFMSQFEEVIGVIIDEAVLPLLEAIQPLINVIIALASVLANTIAPVFEMLGILVDALMPVFTAIGEIIIAVTRLFVNILPPLFAIFEIIVSALLPVLQALSVVFDILRIAIEILNPVFEMLAFVVRVVATPIAILGAIFQWVTNIIYNLGKFINNVIDNPLSPRKWNRGMRETNLSKLIDEAVTEVWEGPDVSDFESTIPDDYDDFYTEDIPVVDDIPTFEGLPPGLRIIIDEAVEEALENLDVPDLEPTIPDDFDDIDTEDIPVVDDIPTFEGPTPGTGIMYGGDVSVQKQPDVYLYITFSGPVIGAGGLVEVGEFVGNSISEYVGAGGSFEWMEAAGG